MCPGGYILLKVVKKHIRAWADLRCGASPAAMDLRPYGKAQLCKKEVYREKSQKTTTILRGKESLEIQTFLIMWQFWSFWLIKLCASRHYNTKKGCFQACKDSVLSSHPPILSGDGCSECCTMTILDSFLFETELLSWFHESVMAVTYLCVLRHSLPKCLQGSLWPPQPAVEIHRRQEGSSVEHGSVAAVGSNFCCLTMSSSL